MGWLDDLAFIEKHHPGDLDAPVEFPRVAGLTSLIPPRNRRYKTPGRDGSPRVVPDWKKG
jgi:hypothetical protein